MWQIREKEAIDLRQENPHHPYYAFHIGARTNNEHVGVYTGFWCDVSVDPLNKGNFQLIKV
jgi:hypothetical protein